MLQCLLVVCCCWIIKSQVQVAFRRWQYECNDKFSLDSPCISGLDVLKQVTFYWCKASMKEVKKPIILLACYRPTCHCVSRRKSEISVEILNIWFSVEAAKDQGRKCSFEMLPATCKYYEWFEFFKCRSQKTRL